MFRFADSDTWCRLAPPFLTPYWEFSEVGGWQLIPFRFRSSDFKHAVTVESDVVEPTTSRASLARRAAHTCSAVQDSTDVLT